MSLIDTLKKSENMRRIFGKQELVIIEKQLLGVKLKPSEKTRLSRDVRKKFEAIKELMPFASIFSLKHGLIIKEIINDAKEAILKSKYFPFIKKIVLFGSAVENQLTMSSDIDIAVKFNKIDKKNATKFRIDIMGKTDKRVDIQVYNMLPDKIKKEIDEKGRMIYERKN